MADQDQGAAIIAQKPLEPQRGFEVEMVGRLVEQQQVGLGEEDRGERDPHAPAARQIADRAPLHRLVEAEPGEDARGPARRRMRVDLDEPRLDLGGAQRLGAGFPLGEQGGALAVGGEHRVQRRRRRRSGPPGRESRSGGRAAIRSRRRPGCNAPRIRSSRVDLPAPLRPTSPTLLPSAICALAWSSRASVPADRGRSRRKGSASRSLTTIGARPGGDEPLRRLRPHRHLRLDLWRLARQFLPARLAPAPTNSHYASRQVDTIEINGTHYSLQRPEFVRALARRDAGGLCLRRQGQPVHHPLEAAPRHRDAARQFLCLRRVAAGGKARAVSVAILAAVQIRRRAPRPFSLVAAAGQRGRRGARRAA